LLAKHTRRAFCHRPTAAATHIGRDQLITDRLHVVTDEFIIIGSNNQELLPTWLGEVPRLKDIIRPA
jgi:hypothetical protein